MSFLWSLAFREIMKATEIHVVGVSFAPGDFELRWLLREALTLSRETREAGGLAPVRLVVTNPDQQARREAKLVTGIVESDRVSEHESLEAYLESVRA
jgi:hypothetical protein